jgi:tetraacyldisaccharide 4'-kinase
LKPETNQSVFFSTYIYDEIYPVFGETNTEKQALNSSNKTKPEVLLVTGIVSTENISEYLNSLQIKTEKMSFPDHYDFQSKDFTAIRTRFENLSSSEKIILVTEKDAARIIGNPAYPETLKAVTYALPIRVKILHNKEIQFIQKIKNYVIENSRNR